MQKRIYIDVYIIEKSSYGFKEYIIFAIINCKLVTLVILTTICSASSQKYLVFLDDLPVRGFIGHLEERGFLPHKHEIFLWNHITFNFEYNKDEVSFYLVYSHVNIFNQKYL